MRSLWAITDSKRASRSSPTSPSWSGSGRDSTGVDGACEAVMGSSGMGSKQWGRPFTDRAVCITVTRDRCPRKRIHRRASRPPDHSARGPQMTALLESYVAGGWFHADDDGAPLLDAVTGEVVARISSKGLDLAAMTGHARQVGGPALRSLTFHERAALLKALAKHLSAGKDELYALSLRTGATHRDSLVDVDGGIGTLFSYASKGARELPNDTVVLD